MTQARPQPRRPRVIAGDAEGKTLVFERVPAPRAPLHLAEGSSPTPLAQVLPPTLEREAFQLARRIAIQSDLPSAVRALQQGLAKLTLSSDAMVIFFDASLCSAFAAPDGNPPRAINEQVQALVAQVASTGQRAMLGRIVIEPVGLAPARAVLVVRRSAGAPAYGPIEIATIAAIATSTAGMLGHFLADHAMQRAQEQRDARSPFRPEVLAARRKGPEPGKIVTTPRTWVRWAYPTLIAIVAAVLTAAAVIQVPLYSTGYSLITVDGAQVTSPVPGTVAEVLVTPNAHVSAGDPLVRMTALQEEAELAATETDYRNALAVFLTNPGDDGARTALATIATQRQRAQAAVDARTLRAPADGTIGDIRVRAGQLVVPGAELLKVTPADAAPSVIAFMPGFDRPRLEVGMTLQIELPGYRDKRTEAVIDSIDSQVIGPDEARRSLGDAIGDALPITGPVVRVRAHLATRTFEAEGREYAFHDGMLGKAEVEVDSQSLLGMLLPGKDH